MEDQQAEKGADQTGAEHEPAKAVTDGAPQMSTEETKAGGAA